MDKQLLLICALTFIIHIIGTLAYSVRIAGIRTRRLALFSILLLPSRISNFAPTYENFPSRHHGK